jgi:hypothetical protein
MPGGRATPACPFVRPVAACREPSALLQARDTRRYERVTSEPVREGENASKDRPQRYSLARIRLRTMG